MRTDFLHKSQFVAVQHVLTWYKATHHVCFMSFLTVLQLHLRVRLNMAETFFGFKGF